MTVSLKQAPALKNGAASRHRAISPRNLEPTPILDYESPSAGDFADSFPEDLAGLDFLQAVHQEICRRIRPIYTVRELQPVSVTIRKGVGSCSQRLACLEALARARGIGTRVRSFWIRGSFWNQRFPLARWFIPGRILLAWPQFRLAKGWRGVEELFGSLPELAPGGRFRNDSQTLFEALACTAVDFEGRTMACASECDLSGHVAETGPTFDSRDQLFEKLGVLETTWRGRAFERLCAGRAG